MDEDDVGSISTSSQALIATASLLISLAVAAILHASFIAAKWPTIEFFDDDGETKDNQRGHEGTDKQDIAKPPLVYQVPQSASRHPPLGITVVCISDTHNHHRDIPMPENADLLIHAGDFTNYGRLEHVVDFNDWLGTLPYTHKVVVEGNHEYRAPWKSRIQQLLSNATFLKNKTIELQVRDQSLKIHGTEFFWPSYDADNYPECFDKISMENVDILISHCPARGHVDCGRGCPALAQFVEQRLQHCRQKNKKPPIVISGHEHDGRGIVTTTTTKTNENSTTWVNCATAESMASRVYGQAPIVLQL